MNAPILASENERLAALDRYDVLDSPMEPGFDRITRLVSRVFDVPMASVSLIDGHRQWLKSRQGPLDQEACRDLAFCNTTIRMRDPLIVEDATLDPRFKDNAFVLGEPHIRFYAGVPLTTEDGFNLGALCVIDTKPRKLDAGQIAQLKDFAALVMDAFEARRQATSNSLTGALTRRAFRDEAARALSLSQRHSHPLSCISFDLDHFKAINDAHGHALGDCVLVEAVSACRERLRNTDIFGRIGGEEFSIVLPHTDAAGALELAGQIRSALERRVIVLPEATIKITASFGIAAQDRNGVDLDELLRRADLALYDAKAAGRNTCVVWKAPEIIALGSMRRVLKAGQIVFNAGRSIIDCTVKALGETAARVEVTSTAGIPDKFKLAITDDGFSRACNVTVKQGRAIEVAFV